MYDRGVKHVFLFIGLMKQHYEKYTFHPEVIVDNAID